MFDDMFLLQEDIIDYSINDDALLPLAEMDEEVRKEFWATLALRHCKNLGARSIAKLLKHYGGAYNAFIDSKNWQKLGIPDSCVQNIICDKWRTEAKKEWDNAGKSSAAILLWRSCAYPQLLRQLPDAPALLYCKGDTTLFKGPCLAIVGSRNASEENKKIAAYFGRELSICGITIISGMALGIDCVAQDSALSGIGKSIGVLGTGIDIEYPLANRYLYKKMADEGLLITEFAPHTPPGVYNFPVRNRIISGLSIGVIVVEAAEKSGSLITARQALEQNREVFAVPGRALNERSRGCQNLLREGAHPLFSLEDIFRELEDELKSYQSDLPVSNKKINSLLQPPKNLTDSKNINIIAKQPANQKKQTDSAAGPPLSAQITEKLISEDNSLKIANLLKSGPLNIDELADGTGISLQELNSLLTAMEILGQIHRLPGAKYAISE